ncbi:hypothetical protein HPB50_020411 [Hyalomma asiaticum]|uniref:Uncharacterized protein n=1 Tax=Hyalomma asiaticum TaxID=266040 RepID=A0ACB7TKY9_HYAAI|nr:hypothetical protein HPB50_020411 [Hyalomma asiaticum]
MADPEAKATGSEARVTTPTQKQLPSIFWALISFEREEPRGDCQLWIRCGIEEVGFYCVPGVSITADENNAARIHALIVGPPRTPHEDGAQAQGTTPNHRLPLPNFWDISLEHEKHNDGCLIQVGCDIREYELCGVPGMFTSTEENSTAKIHTLILGPPRAPYEGSAAAQGTTPDQQLPSTHCSDISFKFEEPTEHYLLCVGCDISEVEFYRVPRVVTSAENSTAMIYTSILGPPDTPYEGGFFHFLMKCPPDYPNSPQRVLLMTTDTGCIWIVPNLCENDKVCLGLLGTPSAHAWSAIQCLRRIFLYMESLLNAQDPIVQGYTLKVLPTLPRWLSGKICYNTVLHHETIRLANCDAVDQCLRRTSACPPLLREVIPKCFLQFYGEYEGAVKKHTHLNGTRRVEAANEAPAGNANK